MDDETPIKSSNVIKGPWKRAKIISKTETDRVTEDMTLIDEIAESIMIPTIHNLSENGVDIKDEEFLSEIGFLNEVIKSIMHRSLGYTHSMSDLISTVMKLETENPLQTYAKFDYDLVTKVVDRMFEEEE